jgi:hypothetical protein
MISKVPWKLAAEVISAGEPIPPGSARTLSVAESFSSSSSSSSSSFPENERKIEGEDEDELARTDNSPTLLSRRAVKPSSEINDTPLW